MDVTSSRLIVAFYLGLGVLVAWVGFLSFRRLEPQAASMTSVLNEDLATAERRTAKRTYPATPPPLPVSASTNPELDTIRQLRDMLDKRTALYRQQNERLARANAEYSRVREEADKYLGLLAELLTREAESPADEQWDGNVSVPSSPSTDPSPILAEKNEESSTPAVALDQALARITDLETLLAQESEITAERTRLLVKIGAPAVPVLTEELASDDPLQRKWAATVLGRLGAQAKDAEGALIMALDDADPEVRRAAEEAIKLID